MTDPHEADDIRRRLHADAQGLNVTADWDDLVGRLRRSYRRRVATIGSVAVLAVVTASGVGFLAGRTGDGSTALEASGGEPASSGTTLEASSGQVPTSDGSPTVVVSAPGTGPVFAGASDSPYADVPPPLTRLALRDGAGGVAVRLYRQDYSTELATVTTVQTPRDGTGDGWTTPRWCITAGDLLAEVSTTELASVAYAPYFAELPPDRLLRVTYQLLGQAEDAPVGVVVGSTGAGVTEVRATFPDGSVDAMTTADGVVALAAPAPWPTDATIIVEAIGDDGSMVATETVSWATNQGWFTPDPTCLPPPPQLPAPGEQPADPAAAEAAVRSVVEQLVSSETTIDSKLALIDDPAGIEEALAAVEASWTATEFAASATVDEVVFTAPDRAAVRYTVTAAYGTFPDRIGEVTLIDGTWKMAKASVCSDLTQAGGACGDLTPFPTIPPLATTAAETTTPGG